MSSSNLFDQGAALVANTLNQRLSSTITYRRGASRTQLKATLGRTLFEQADEYGGVTKTESRDYIVLAADLKFDDAEILPRAGDQITESKGLVSEVCSYFGQPVYVYSDPTRLMVRIHTKYIKTEG